MPSCSQRATSSARQTVAGGSVGVAVASDDTVLQVLGVLVLVLNAVADFVLEVRTRQRLNVPPPAT